MDAAGRCLVMTICAGALLACGGGGDNAAVAGGEGSQCYPNGTCNPGLTCLSTFCVRAVLDGGATKDARGLDDGTHATTDGHGAPAVPLTPAAHPVLPQVATLGATALGTPKAPPIA